MVDTPESIETMRDRAEGLLYEIRDAMARTRESLATFAATVEATGKRAKQTAEDAVDATTDWAENEPLQAVLVTFAVGCALGLLFSFRRRD